MLIHLTDKCTMNCSHCMGDFKKENSSFMGNETLENILNNFLFKNSLLVNITGGEPTEHPNFFYILEKILESKQCSTTLITNGLWLKDKHVKKEVFKFLKRYEKFSVQVTNDPDFYPIHIDDINHEKIYIERRLKFLINLGKLLFNIIILE